jgi:hypothetical protein
MKQLAKIEKIKYNDKKHFYKEVDVWVSSLLNRGVIFFGLTINFVADDVDNNLIFYVEDTKSALEELLSLNKHLAGIDFIDCGIGAIEKGESGIPHVHCVFGFRAHFNCIHFIREKIEVILTNTYKYDYKLSYLSYFKDVVQSIRYLSKDFEKPRDLNLAFYCEFSPIFLNIHTTFGDRIESLNFIEKHTNLNYFGHIFSGIQRVLGKYHNIDSIPLRIREHELHEVTYYLKMYFNFKHIFIYNNNLYIKIKGTRISYEFLGTEDIIKDNFFNFMVELKSEVFDFIDPAALSTIFSENYKKIIDQVKMLCRYFKKNLSFDILEFKDGVYLAAYDRFIFDPGVLQSFEKMFFTIRFYNLTYVNLLTKTKIPSLWKSKLLLNFNEDEFKSFCLVFRHILFGGEERTKRNILFLIGVTNSGKSRLVLDIAKASVGIENVGTLSTDPKFLVENLVGKAIAILDEPDLTMKMLNSLKKLGSGEALNINAKFEKSTYDQLTTQILAASNPTPEIEAILKDDAMKSRIWKFVLENECPLSTKEYNNVLKELPKILVYCNKLYFEALIEKKRLTTKKLLLFFENKFKLLK